VTASISLSMHGKFREASDSSEVDQSTSSPGPSSANTHPLLGIDSLGCASSQMRSFTLLDSVWGVQIEVNSRVEKAEAFVINFESDAGVRCVWCTTISEHRDQQRNNLLSSPTRTLSGATKDAVSKLLPRTRFFANVHDELEWIPWSSAV